MNNTRRQLQDSHGYAERIKKPELASRIQKMLDEHPDTPVAKSLESALAKHAVEPLTDGQLVQVLATARRINDRELLPLAESAFNVRQEQVANPEGPAVPVVVLAPASPDADEASSASPVSTPVAVAADAATPDSAAEAAATRDPPEPTPATTRKRSRAAPKPDQEG